MIGLYFGVGTVNFISCRIILIVYMLINDGNIKIMLLCFLGLDDFLWFRYPGTRVIQIEDLL
jgi:hypothetical protein